MPGTAAAPLAGRVAVVTGASGGLGEAIGTALHEHGASVALLARRRRRLEAIARRLDGPERVVALPTDVADPFELVEAREAVHERLGVADLVVVSAGVFASSPFEDAIPAEWDAMIDTNLKGLLQTAQTFMPDLVAAAGRGRCADLVLIGSRTAGRLERDYAVYSAVYASVAQLARHLRTELGPRGVRVRTVMPHYAESRLGTRVFDNEQRALTEQRRDRARWIPAARVAELVTFTCALPSHVNLAEVTIQPTEVE